MASELQVTVEGVWAAVGVDDLMKYRVVEFLYRPGSETTEIGSGDLADALGFRAPEVLEDELRELSSHGVVAPSGQDGCWRVARDERLRAKLRGILAAEAASPERKGEVISALARRSLARTRAKSRGIGARGVSRASSDGAMRAQPLRPAS